MSEERKRPRIRKFSVNRDEERGSENMSYGSREGGEDSENRFERRFRSEEGDERRPFRSFGDRPRRGPKFGLIQDLNTEREKLAKGEPLGRDPEEYERRDARRGEDCERRNFDENGPRFERRERRFGRFGRPDEDDRPILFGRPEEDERPRRFDRAEGEDRPRRFERRDGDDRPGRGERPRRFERRDGDERTDRRGRGDRPVRFAFRDDSDERQEYRERRGGFDQRRRPEDGERRRRFEGGDRPEGRRASAPRRDEGKKSVYSKKKQLEHQLKHENESDELRLNRFIAKGGVCSRRDADGLIQAGRVKVNGVVVDQLGVKVKRTDKVEVDGQVVTPERKVYIVLNKPKDYVTTMDDPNERKTVMSLIEGACDERVYPIGRLDRQTTGVLLFTNDGDLAKKLTHPSYNQKKIYHVFLDKAVKISDLEAIMKGVELEDGFIQPDDVRVAEDDNTQVGIEIHSGRNRIVRRIFEHFGYQIVKLDRVFFAGITKKNLPRGHWRFLTKEEVNTLKAY